MGRILKAIVKILKAIRCKCDSSCDEQPVNVKDVAIKL